MNQRCMVIALALGLPLAVHAGEASRPSGAPAGWPEPIHDTPIFTYALIDRLEYQARDGEDALSWEAQGWAGTDYDRLWLKTEGEKVFDGGVEAAEVQLLYGRFLGGFWDLQAGLRYDLEPDPERAFGVLGVQGLAPGWFEVEAAAFISEDADVSARLEAEYDLLLTRRLVAQPLVELDAAAQDVEELGIGAGLTGVELGLRLRYEIRPELAPYIGVSWERKLGETADIARDEGEDAGELSFVAGLRIWF